MREQIRDAYVSALIGLPITEGRVFDTPIYPQEDDALPGYAVRTVTDRLGEIENNGKRVQRDLELEVEARYRGEEDTVAPMLDEIAVNAEIELQKDVTLGGLVHWTECTETDFEFTGEQHAPLGIATLRFRSVYYTLTDDPTVIG